MKKIIEYKIVSNEIPNELVSEVNSLINNGWIPTGGICIMQSPTPDTQDGFQKISSISFQAMVKLQVY